MKQYKTPEYTRKAHKAYNDKGLTKHKCISIELAGLLNKHKDYGYTSIIEWSKAIALIITVS